MFKRLPDLVVSGINKGWNLGDDVTYSGTVAGALEGALLGDAGHGRVARSSRVARTISPTPRSAGRYAGRRDVATSAAAADVSEHQRAERAAEGLSGDGAGAGATM